ncbi:MAG: hypothetical protein HFJ41_03430 [Clostridia bacterium]|nr:hypothetical protein [Clostridia bacterium]
MEYKTIKEIAKINPENINKDYNRKYIMYLDTANITLGRIDEIVKIDISNAPSRAKRIVREKDIIYSTVRPNLCHYGILRNVIDNMIVSTGFSVIRCDNTKIIPEYLYAYLTLPYITEKLHAIAETSTSAYPSIKPSDLENLIVPVPDMDTQNRIARILSNIDKKIELNSYTNDNLHKLLKNIYNELFIENKKEYWVKARLGNYLKVERGLSYKGKYLSKDGIPMINLGNVMADGVFRIEKNKYYIGAYKEKVSAEVGDIVVANTDMTQNREVIGTPVIIPPLYDNKVIFSHHIYGLKDLKLPKMFVFYTLLTKEWNGVAGGSATGTTVLALPKDAIEDYLISIPDDNTLKRFENIATDIQSKREQILLESINLEQLRDTLLPKLLNGEIDLDKIEI